MTAVRARIAMREASGRRSRRARARADDVVAPRCVSMRPQNRGHDSHLGAPCRQAAFWRALCLIQLALTGLACCCARGCSTARARSCGSAATACFSLSHRRITLGRVTSRSSAWCSRRRTQGCYTQLKCRARVSARGVGSSSFEIAISWFEDYTLGHGNDVARQVGLALRADFWTRLRP